MNIIRCCHTNAKFKLCNLNYSLALLLTLILLILIFLTGKQSYAFQSAMNYSEIDINNYETDTSYSEGGFNFYINNLEIKKVTSYYTGETFLYTVIPTSKKVALVTDELYNRINGPVDSLDFSRLKIIQCGLKEGPSSEIRSKQSITDNVVSHQDVYGTTGYESTRDACHIARSNEFKWFNDTTSKNGRNRLFYSTNLDGDIQCFSLDGVNCVWINHSRQILIDTAQEMRSINNNKAAVSYLLNKYAQITITPRPYVRVRRLVLPNWTRQGRRIHLHDTSFWGTRVYLPGGRIETVRRGQIRTWTFLGNSWYQEGTNINDYPSITQAAKPLVCGEQHKKIYGATGYDKPNHWCNVLSNPKIKRKYTVQAMIDAKMANIDDIFKHMSSYEYNKVYNSYANRIKDLNNKVARKKRSVYISCKVKWFNIPGLIACRIYKSQYNNLRNALNSLTAERNDKARKARLVVSKKRQEKWHKLHETWAKNDKSHFAVLLKEESETLAELKELNDIYEKKSEEEHAEYLEYIKKASPSEVLLEQAEDLPLIGPEIKHIVDYANNPSGDNLRKMLLGAFGPVGENVEGIVEVTKNGSQMNDPKVKYITDLLHDIGHDHSIGEVFEDVVSDTINDFGDEAIESLREMGVWKKSKSDIRTLDYQNIVDLRASLTSMNYDFWQGRSEKEIQVQTTFTPSNFKYLAYLTSSKYYGSLADIEYSSGGKVFAAKLNAIFKHSFGYNHNNIIKKNKRNKWTLSELNKELYKVIADPVYYEQRLPYLVDSSVIGPRPAAFIYNNDHSFIAINKDLVDLRSDDFYKFYFEELGHMVNWWRCKILEVEISECELTIDSGARFRDAILIDPTLHEETFESLLFSLPEHTEVDSDTVKFQDNSFVSMAGWPAYYTLNDNISGDGKMSWLMRIGVEIKSGEYQFITDEIDFEIVVNAPELAMKGNPWKVSNNGVCKDDTQTDCNVPTMWLSLGVRDAIKIVVGNIPKVKSSKYTNTGFDLLPMAVRTHAGNIPYQVESVNSVKWKHVKGYNIYSKEFSGRLVAKLDLVKIIAVNKGKELTHKPELSFKPVAGGSYIVEIPTIDKKELGTWLALDVSSELLGCGLGAAVAVVTEQDPIVLCHAGSFLTELTETFFETGFGRVTVALEGGASLGVPSIEYRYAKSSSRITPAQDDTQPSGVETDVDSPGTGNVSGPGSPNASRPGSPNVSRPDSPNVSSLKTKTRSALGKMRSSTFTPVIVFRPRVSWSDSTIIREGRRQIPIRPIEE